jgi:S-adenosylmethionine:tRNA ribosyltransferase-isomerase
MNAASGPLAGATAERLLAVDPVAGSLDDRQIFDLPEILAPGDLLVVNDAATLPASLPGRSPAGPVEVRLLESRTDGTWRAVLFGPGDWRTRTEERAPPPPLAPGSPIDFDGLAAAVARVDHRSPRLVDLRFDRSGAALWSALYRSGRPVQYAHVAAPLAIDLVQTAWGARPWAAEMPSAGRPLRWGLLRALRARGVALATLTHAAGLSATGDAALDAALPLPERYEIPAATVAAIAAARRVVAVGTTVVRALEGNAAAHGRLLPGSGETDLRLGPGARLRVVDGLLTGIHEPDSSHTRLVAAFLRPALLDRVLGHAEKGGYLGHEFGDSLLVLPRGRAASLPG